MEPYQIGRLIGSLGVGLALGLWVYSKASKHGQTGIGIGGLVGCVVCGYMGGLILGIPFALLMNYFAGRSAESAAHQAGNARFVQGRQHAPGFGPHTGPAPAPGMQPPQGAWAPGHNPQAAPPASWDAQGQAAYGAPPGQPMQHVGPQPTQPATAVPHGPGAGAPASHPYRSTGAHAAAPDPFGAAPASISGQHRAASEGIELPEEPVGGPRGGFVTASGSFITTPEQGRPTGGSPAVPALQPIEMDDESDPDWGREPTSPGAQVERNAPPVGSDSSFFS